MRLSPIYIIAAAVTACSSASAQVIDVWPGVAPGSERWTQRERTIEGTPVGTVVMNVVKPTLTAYLPDRAHATGAGVIVAPGGGFVALAISLEATELAKWLQQRGVAAFVLKYRTIEKKVDGIPAMDMDTAGRYGIADGIQALKVVRAHANEWGLSRNRIGMIGFSAGAMVTSAAMLQRDATLRPSFAALIYGAPFGKMPMIPADLPPIFMAWAKDDAVALAPVVKFHDVLVAAGQPPETHVYAKGGHGFGMKHQGTDSDRWIDDYQRWLRSLGMTDAVPHPRSPTAPQPRK
jgi:acetyl esterase/lipase